MVSVICVALDHEESENEVVFHPEGAAAVQEGASPDSVTFRTFVAVPSPEERYEFPPSAQGMVMFQLPNASSCLSFCT